MGTIIMIIGMVILGSYVINKRNEFEQMRRKVKHEASNIGIQIDKRAECLHDAMKIAQISHAREVEGIERLTAKDQLDRLAFLGEKYPVLQNIPNYQFTLMKAVELDEDLAAARQLLNGDIRTYNDAITSFPGLLIAKIFGYKEERFIDEENIESNKKLRKREIDFSEY